MEMVAGLFTVENAIALLTLSVMEIVLGIDNIVMLSILTNNLPENQRGLGRKIGLGLAMIARLGLLWTVSWIAKLTDPLVTIFTFEITGRAIVLFIGGMFLVGKATFEIHRTMEEAEREKTNREKAVTFAMVMVQVAVLDAVFSLDSVITAVGMAQHISIMAVAIVIAITVMLIFSSAVSTFIDRHPTVKMLALAFLILIGVMLLADGLGKHIDRAYIYFAMGFSVLVEVLNLRLRHKHARAAKLI